ncbi:isoprenylcysteine carboxylmethyltransferase family protein [Chitinivorax sp. PXF-14]|uniref:methyltransferase family protein n=1 Tax=Chitinivorax sp. PXF-14 TaxID=3230488 RepID=UPI003465FDE5
MPTLELKIPPPVVALIMGGAMWGISRYTPGIDMPLPARVALALVLPLLGGGISYAGASAFRRARTTVNPLKPEQASTLVTGGIYRLTRNPMYVGGALVLLGWMVFLAAPWALVGPIAFVAYITRFQIMPEERVLAARFGEAYGDYRAKVRRWL